MHVLQIGYIVARWQLCVLLYNLKFTVCDMIASATASVFVLLLLQYVTTT
jgi:hypothetical protein